MLSVCIRKFNRFEACERLTFLILSSAIVLNVYVCLTRTWFELPGVAVYGLWTGDWIDFADREYFVFAFLSNEPGMLHRSSGHHS